MVEENRREEERRVRAGHHGKAGPSCNNSKEDEPERRARSGIDRGEEEDGAEAKEEREREREEEKQGACKGDPDKRRSDDVPEAGSTTR